MANNILDHPQTRQKKKQRKHYKYEYKIAIEKKNDKNRKIALNNYRNSQMELKKTIEHHITENIEKRLKTIAQQGLNSKPFWDIVRQIKRNNSEDLIAIKYDKGSRLFSEEEIKLHSELLQKIIHKKSQSKLQPTVDKFHK